MPVNKLAIEVMSDATVDAMCPSEGKKATDCYTASRLSNRLFLARSRRTNAGNNDRNGFDSLSSV